MRVNDIIKSRLMKFLLRHRNLLFGRLIERFNGRELRKIYTTNGTNEPLFIASQELKD